MLLKVAIAVICTLAFLLVVNAVRGQTRSCVTTYVGNVAITNCT